MKKIILMLLFVGGFAASTMAQSSNDGGKFNIGVEAGLPVGDASNLYTTFLGASIKYEYPVAESVFVTGSVGYNAGLIKSEIKDALGFQSAYSYIPLKAGLKYYVQEGFFVEGQLGATISTESGAGAAFTYAPGIGYTFDGGFEAGVRYEAWSKNGTTSQIGLRIGYRF